MELTSLVIVSCTDGRGVVGISVGISFLEKSLRKYSSAEFASSLECKKVKRNLASLILESRGCSLASNCGLNVNESKQKYLTCC